MQQYKVLIITVLMLLGLVLFFNPDIFSEGAEVAAKASPPKEIVYNSSYDSSVRQVEDWFKDNLNDPDSISYVEWSQVVKSPEGNFMVRCKYRAKNLYGAMVLENKVFFFGKSGDYIYQTDFQPS